MKSGTRRRDRTSWERKGRNLILLENEIPGGLYFRANPLPANVTHGPAVYSIFRQITRGHCGRPDHYQAFQIKTGIGAFPVGFTLRCLDRTVYSKSMTIGPERWHSGWETRRGNPYNWNLGLRLHRTSISASLRYFRFVQDSGFNTIRHTTPSRRHRQAVGLSTGIVSCRAWAAVSVPRGIGFEA